MIVLRATGRSGLARGATARQGNVYVCSGGSHQQRKVMANSWGGTYCGMEVCSDPEVMPETGSLPWEAENCSSECRADVTCSSEIVTASTRFCGYRSGLPARSHLPSFFFPAEVSNRELARTVSTNFTHRGECVSTLPTTIN